MEAAASGAGSILEVCGREAQPLQWAQARKLLGHVYEAMGDLSEAGSQEHYGRALGEIECALEVLEGGGGGRGLGRSAGYEGTAGWQAAGVSALGSVSRPKSIAEMGYAIERPTVGCIGGLVRGREWRTVAREHAGRVSLGAWTRRHTEDWV